MCLDESATMQLVMLRRKCANGLRSGAKPVDCRRRCEPGRCRNHRILPRLMNQEVEGRAGTHNDNRCARDQRQSARQPLELESQLRETDRTENCEPQVNHYQ